MMSLMRGGWVVLAAAACAAAEPDPADVLARLGATTRKNVTRMVNYTCVQTIDRRYYQARLRTAPRNCDDLAGEKKKPGYKLTLERTDRLRLDVRTDATGEMYSWPGADRFEDRDPWYVIGYGPAATGLFGMLPLQVVQGDATDFVFLGKTEAGGRKFFQYAFRVPVERSHHSVDIAGELVATSWDGTILLDPETSELVRMTSRTSELPRDAFSCEIATASDYGPVTVGGRELPFPRGARQRFIQRDGLEIESTVTYSACREYKAKSQVDFGSASGEAPSAPAMSPPAPALDLTSGLPVSIELSTRIDSETAAAGDRFKGRLAKPVKDSRRGVIIPAGSPVEGWLAEVAVQMRPSEVTIVLKAETVEIEGTATPFLLAGKTAPKGGALSQFLSSLSIGGRGGTGRGSPGTGLLTPQLGLNTLTFPGKRKLLEPGFRTEWVTLKP